MAQSAKLLMFSLLSTSVFQNLSRLKVLITQINYVLYIVLDLIALHTEFLTHIILFCRSTSYADRTVYERQTPPAGIAGKSLLHLCINEYSIYSDFTNLAQAFTDLGFAKIFDNSGQCLPASFLVDESALVHIAKYTHMKYCTYYSTVTLKLN